MKMETFLSVSRLLNIVFFLLLKLYGYRCVTKSTIIIFINIEISLLFISYWPLSQIDQPAVAIMSCEKLINVWIYWRIIVVNLSDHHRHHGLMTKKTLSARRQELRASKITPLVSVLWISTANTSLATAFRLKVFETCIFTMNLSSLKRASFFSFLKWPEHIIDKWLMAIAILNIY